MALLIDKIRTRFSPCCLCARVVRFADGFSLLGLFLQILLAGKSINFLHQTCHDRTRIRDRDAVRHAETAQGEAALRMRHDSVTSQSADSRVHDLCLKQQHSVLCESDQHDANHCGRCRGGGNPNAFPFVFTSGYGASLQEIERAHCQHFPHFRCQWRASSARTWTACSRT